MLFRRFANGLHWQLPHLATVRLMVRLIAPLDRAALARPVFGEHY